MFIQDILQNATMNNINSYMEAKGFRIADTEQDTETRHIHYFGLLDQVVAVTHNPKNKIIEVGLFYDTTDEDKTLETDLESAKFSYKGKSSTGNKVWANNEKNYYFSTQIKEATYLFCVVYSDESEKSEILKLNPNETKSK